MKMFFSGSKGFTLIELAIVVAIVGILAAVAVPIFDSFSDNSKIDELKSRMLIAATSQEKFFLSKGRYGTTPVDGTVMENAYDFPSNTEQMKITTGVIIKEGVGMGYWINGVRKIRDNLHCWLYTSSFMDTTEKTNFREYKQGDNTGFSGVACSW